MGMFDSVFVKCKEAGCDGMVEFQSKAGRCECKRYTLSGVPLPIAAELDGETERCKKCKCEMTIRIPMSTPKFLNMEIKPDGEDEDYD